MTTVATPAFQVDASGSAAYEAAEMVSSAAAMATRMIMAPLRGRRRSSGGERPGRSRRSETGRLIVAVRAERFQRRRIHPSSVGPASRFAVVAFARRTDDAVR